MGEIDLARQMNKISVQQYGQALGKQRALNDAQWLQRCDELAIEQPTLFFELLTFPRDGVPGDIFRQLIDYLSALQYATQSISESLAAPISLEEFKASILRMGRFFHAITTDDQAHFGEMMAAWVKGMQENGQPVIWAGCVETLSGSEMSEQPLFKEIACTLAGIADAYANRFKAGVEPAKGKPDLNPPQI